MDMRNIIYIKYDIVKPPHDITKYGVKITRVISTVNRIINESVLSVYLLYGNNQTENVTHITSL